MPPINGNGLPPPRLAPGSLPAGIGPRPLTPSQRPSTPTGPSTRSAPSSGPPTRSPSPTGSLASARTSPRASLPGREPSSQPSGLARPQPGASLHRPTLNRPVGQGGQTQALSATQESADADAMLQELRDLLGASAAQVDELDKAHGKHDDPQKVLEELTKTLEMMKGLNEQLNSLVEGAGKSFKESA